MLNTKISCFFKFEFFVATASKHYVISSTLVPFKSTPVNLSACLGMLPLDRVHCTAVVVRSEGVVEKGPNDK